MKKSVLFRADEVDLRAIRELRERWGIPSNSATIRLAIRVAAQLGDEWIRPLLQAGSNRSEMEVEK